jgi:hypothetical protein
VRGRRGVTRIPELAHHLLVRQDLTRVIASELEQPAQQRRLVDPREQQHVARGRGLDPRVLDVAAPSVLVADQRRGATGRCARSSLPVLSHHLLYNRLRVAGLPAARGIQRHRRTQGELPDVCPNRSRTCKQ